MNPFSFPHIPPIAPPNENIITEIEKIIAQLNDLEKRIKTLEQKKENNYLQKEDGMYMI